MKSTSHIPTILLVKIEVTVFDVICRRCSITGSIDCLLNGVLTQVPYLVGPTFHSPSTQAFALLLSSYKCQIIDEWIFR